MNCIPERFDDMTVERFFVWCKNFIWFIFTAIIGYLFLFSLLSTSVIGELVYVKKDSIEYSGEHTFYISDCFLRQIFIIVLVIGLAYIFNSFICKRRTFIFPGKIVRWIIPGAFFLAGILFVANTNLYPRSDQEMVLKIASEMRDGIFGEFEKGGYLYKCPHQKGIVFFCFLTSFVFQEYNYIALQYMNVMFSVGIIYLLGSIGKIIFLRPVFLTELLSILFLPLIFYTTFVYGTIPSLFLALLAIYSELRYWETRKTGNVILSAISIAFSISLKSNSVIFLIVMVMYWFYMSVHTKKYDRKIIYGLLFILLPIIVQGSINLFLENYSGCLLEKGIPKTAYIAMGLQDSQYASGWWNGYNWNIYDENDHDTERTEKRAQEDIKNSIKYFWDNKKEGISFFNRKILSQWNNPTFQCFDVLSYRQPKGNTSDFMQSIYTGFGRYLLSGYMNYFQSLLLMGTLIFIGCNYRKITMPQTFLAVCFIGGFLFHLIWEAKCQYTFPYFLLLMPYASMGFRNVFERGKRDIIKWLAFIVAGAVILQVLLLTTPFKKIVMAEDNNGAGKEYQSDYVMREYIQTE